MLDAIRRLLSGEGPAEGDDLKEARICAAALLVEAALADGIYAEIEAKLIASVLQETFAIDAGAAANLLAAAEERAEGLVDHVTLTRVVKRLALEERERLVESIWRVVFADGEESPFEDAFVRRVSALLAVDDRASRMARRRVADDLSGGSDETA